MGVVQSKKLLALVELEVGQGQSPRLSADVARQVFADFDKSRDGVLDRGEAIKFIGTYLRAHGETSPSAERVLRLFAALDTDKSGTLSFTELTGLPRTVGEHDRHMFGIASFGGPCGAFTPLALLCKQIIVDLLEVDWRRNPIGSHPFYTLRRVCREFAALVAEMALDGLLTPPHTAFDVSLVQSRNFIRSHHASITAPDVRRLFHREPWFAAVDKYIDDMSSRVMRSFRFEDLYFVTDAPIEDDGGKLSFTVLIGDRAKASRAMQIGEPLNVRISMLGRQDTAVDDELKGARDEFAAWPKDFWCEFLNLDNETNAREVHRQLRGHRMHMANWGSWYVDASIFPRDVPMSTEITIDIAYNGASVGHVKFQPVVIGALRSELHGNHHHMSFAFMRLQPSATVAPEFIRRRSVLVMNKFQYDL
jgi:hypothetical protein